MKVRNNYIKFIFNSEEKKTIHKIECVTLQTILREFQEFLYGAGFYMVGNIEIVPDEDSEEQEECCHSACEDEDKTEDKHVTKE